VYIGLFAFFALLLVALFGERIAPHESIYFVVQHGRDPRPYDPGLVFPFGSDILGRDLFSLVLAGARLTLTIVVLGGVARVAAGLLLAVASSWSGRTRVVIDGLAELVAAVPATLVVLLVVLMFVRGDTTIGIFVGGLLITGWAGPYRVLRAELDRLGHMPFTEGAAAIGVGRLRILVRHHVRHLVPLIAMNTSQQVVASLVALAELGVLAVFVGTNRFVNIAMSLGLVQEVGQTNAALIADPPEWGGLLANARTIDSLWTTRWLFLVPGAAFALTAVAVAALGYAISRVYARRDLFGDLRRPPARVLALVTVGLVLVSFFIPERYAAAGEWASAARAATVGASSDVERAFSEAGLQPVGATFAVERDNTQIVRSAPATVRIGSVERGESADAPVDVRAFVDADTGGGRVEAPVVYLGHGISPRDYPPRIVQLGSFNPPDLGAAIEGFADAYSGIDVRGKIVVLLRYRFVVGGLRDVQGPDVESSILNAKKHGAAAIVFVDPDLTRYVNIPTSFTTPVNPYTRLEAGYPVTGAGGVPVVVISPKAADELLAPLGMKPSAGPDSVDAGSDEAKRSISRDLGVRGIVDVPLTKASAHVRSLVAEVPGFANDAGRVVVWAVHRPAAAHPVEPLVVGLARELGRRGAAVVIVLFDPAVDPTANSRDVATVLAARHLTMFVVLDALDGTRSHPSVRSLRGQSGREPCADEEHRIDE
jgi:ABC-type dipeptide/oligopeptide/nickel transport system permease subunit